MILWQYLPEVDLRNKWMFNLVGGEGDAFVAGPDAVTQEIAERVVFFVQVEHGAVGNTCLVNNISADLGGWKCSRSLKTHRMC